MWFKLNINQIDIPVKLLIWVVSVCSGDSDKADGFDSQYNPHKSIVFFWLLFQIMGSTMPCMWNSYTTIGLDVLQLSSKVPALFTLQALDMDIPERRDVRGGSGGGAWPRHPSTRRILDWPSRCMQSLSLRLCCLLEDVTIREAPPQEVRKYALHQLLVSRTLIENTNPKFEFLSRVATERREPFWGLKMLNPLYWTERDVGGLKAIGFTVSCMCSQNGSKSYKDQGNPRK